MVYKEEVGMSMKKVLVVSPHPDDETLGAGGTLLKHKDMGDKLYWCNITNIKEEYGYSLEDVKRRNYELEEVAKYYNFDEFFNLEFKPTSLNELSIPVLIKHISGIIDSIKPEILYIPFYGDAHSDHRIVFKALQPFLKSFRYPFIKKVLMMEIISETDNQFVYPFHPNVFIDVSEYIEKKLKIMSVYQTEIGTHPFPRSLENIKNLSSYRGSQCNCKCAESFVLLKWIG